MIASPRPDRMKTTVLYQSCVTSLTVSRVIVRNAAAPSAPVAPIGICLAMSVLDRIPLRSVDLKASASQVANDQQRPAVAEQLKRQVDGAAGFFPGRHFTVPFLNHFTIDIILAMRQCFQL
jgi:hypothetical protein